MKTHTQSESEVVATTESTSNTKSKQLLAQSRYSEFSGPLPPPEILAKYEDVYPGAAKTIFQMAEKQSEHRRNMESENLRLAARDSSRGSTFGFIIAISGILSGLAIVYLNPSSAANAIGGSIVSGGSLVAIIQTFVSGSRKKPSENKENE